MDKNLKEMEMAVYVDISKTRHLTYSPLNEKHNILYDAARQRVNRRHLHKPHFDLNPFLDKTGDSKAVSFDNFKLENNTGILPLPSLVVVEDYFEEEPHLVQEFSIGEFWDFLFSDSWQDGYSVRVLEGQLMGLLVTKLVKLTKVGQVTQHSTVAYAKNTRHQKAVYKHSKPYQKFAFDETLLLEFIYYGHIRRPCSTLYECSTCSYPETATCSTTTYGSDDILSDKECAENTERVPEVQPPSKPPTPVEQKRQKLLRKRVRNHGGRVSQIQDHSVAVGSHSRADAQAKVTPGPPVPTQSSESITSNDYNIVPDSVDLRKFRCTEKVSYLGEFDLSDDSSSSDDDDDIDFGQTYYLGDRGTGHPEVTDSTQSRLRRRKDIVAKERQIRRKFLEEERAKPVQTSILPEFSELDVKKYLSASEVHVSQEEVESVPDLAEYIAIMKKQEKQDSKYKTRFRLRYIQLRNKYSTVDPKCERFADTVGGITDSQACRIHCYSKLDVAWSFLSVRSKRTFLASKLHAAGGKVVMPTIKQKPKRFRREQRKLQIPLIYVTTVNGFQFLHPISQQILQARREKEKASAKKISGLKRTLLVPKVPTLKRQKSRSSPLPEKRPHVSNTKIKDTEESPDEDSESESDGLDDCPFNTKKLNIRYSLERLGKVTAKAKTERKKPKAEPDFMAILRKYYRMQSVLKAFGKGKSGGEKVGISGLQKKRQERSKDIKKQQASMTVGKLKWFKFLDTKKPAAEPQVSFDKLMFSSYPLRLFRENLERALDEFVVRKELIISDHTGKASVSVTFTKKTVFTKPKTLIE